MRSSGSRLVATLVTAAVLAMFAGCSSDDGVAVGSFGEPGPVADDHEGDVSDPGDGSDGAAAVCDVLQVSEIEEILGQEVVDGPSPETAARAGACGWATTGFVMDVTYFDSDVIPRDECLELYDRDHSRELEDVSARSFYVVEEGEGSVVICAPDRLIFVNLTSVDYLSSDQQVEALNVELARLVVDRLA